MGGIKAGKAKEPGKFRQFVAAMVVNLAALTYGTMIGWQSPMAPRLQNDVPPVGTVKMSNEEVSWLTGSMCVGGILATPIMGPITEKVGRKMIGCFLGIPFLTSCFLTIFATGHVHLFVSRFLAGVGGAGAIFLIPLYVSEISSDANRGMLGSLLLFMLNFGILLAYIFGAILSFQAFAIFITVLPVLFLGGIFFLPETPVYLVHRNKLREANESLIWLKAGDKCAAERELQRLQITAAKDAAALTKSVSFLDLFKNKATVKGLVISLGLFAGQQLCGIFAMVSYTETIFRVAGSSLSPNMAAIIIGVIQLVGSYLSTSLIERAGRRLLLLISCGGMAICHYVISAFCYFQEGGYDVIDYGSIPVVALSVFMITYCLGMGPGPYVITAEIFDRDISSLATTVALVFVWCMGFIVSKFFTNLVDLLGMYGCFFALGSSCVISLIFVAFLVPETKGRSREDILRELNGGYWPEKVAEVEKFPPVQV